MKNLQSAYFLAIALVFLGLSSCGSGSTTDRGHPCKMNGEHPCHMYDEDRAEDMDMDDEDKDRAYHEQDETESYRDRRRQDSSFSRDN